MRGPIQAGQGSLPVDGGDPPRPPPLQQAVAPQG